MTRRLRHVLPACLFVFTACAERPLPTGPGGVAPVVVNAASVSMSVVMSSLNSPRGLAWGPEGALYVAEAGTTATNGPCIQFMEGLNLATRCYSGTGSISRLWKGQQERVLSGLASSHIVQSGFTSGPQDIGFLGRGNGYVTIGCGCEPHTRTELGPGGSLLGTVIDFNPSGHWRVVADIAAFEEENNPWGGPIDSNPYGLLVEGGQLHVVDAGGNALLRVSQTGRVSLVTAAFPVTLAPPPFMQAEPVPTRVKRGPDGALYVSTLSGAPFLDGSAGIYRVVPGQAPELWAGGFKAITDFDFGDDGSVYVVQFASGLMFFGGPGMLIRRAPDDTRTVIAADLFHPTGVLAAPDGSVYVSNSGSGVSPGEVRRYSW